MKTQTNALPGIVTVTIPQEIVLTIGTGEAVPIELKMQPGLQYDLSTLHVLCGARRTSEQNELVLEEDTSMGLQLSINTIPAEYPEDVRSQTLMVCKE